MKKQKKKNNNTSYIQNAGTKSKYSLQIRNRIKLLVLILKIIVFLIGFNRGAALGKKISSTGSFWVKKNVDIGIVNFVWKPIKL